MTRQAIVFVTHNMHKKAEVQRMMPQEISILNLADIEWKEEIEEPFHTFEENATAKALRVSAQTGLPCFADDSGLVIDGLQGRPGVDSAHYAGPQRNDNDNIRKVLNELGTQSIRNAQFICVIAYCIPDETVQLFKGTVNGRITNEIHGEGGFGYDPIFIPEGFDKTFGQLSASIKNRISHRADAMRRFVRILDLRF